MLDFRRLSAVDSTRLCELRLPALPSPALVGWLSSVTELNSYQLFIIHPITSISTPVCDLPTTGGLFVRFSSMETYMLVECLSSAKAFFQSPLQTDFPHFISHSVISDISCSALTQWQDVITFSQRICDGRKVWTWFGLLDVVAVNSFFVNMSTTISIAKTLCKFCLDARALLLFLVLCTHPALTQRVHMESSRREHAEQKGDTNKGTQYWVLHQTERFTKDWSSR